MVGGVRKGAQSDPVRPLEHSAVLGDHPSMFSARRSWLATLSLAVAALLASPAIADADASGDRPTTSTKRSSSSPSSTSYTLTVGTAPLVGVKISNIHSKVDVIEYQDGSDLHLSKRAGRTKVTDPVLLGKGPMPPMLKTWWVDTVAGKSVKKKVTVTVSGAKHVLLQTFPISVSVNPAKNTWKMELAVEQAKYFQ